MAQQEVSFYLAGEDLQVMGDEASRRQLCLILIDNASKYTPPTVPYLSTWRRKIVPPF